MWLIQLLLAVSALYSASTYLFLAVYSLKTRTNVETETFHLGLCFILSIGFLGLMIHGG